MKILLDTHIFLWAITGDSHLRATRRDYYSDGAKQGYRGQTPLETAELGSLPLIHRDPFDRMPIAQARAEKIPILSSDSKLRQYDVTLL